MSGPEASWPPKWEAAAELSGAQLETNPDEPHSINIWFVLVDDDAYVSSSLVRGAEKPEEREWIRNVEADDRVRVRVDGTVYPARLEQIDDADRKQRVLEAFQAKYPELEASRGVSARYYRVVAR